MVASSTRPPLEPVRAPDGTTTYRIAGWPDVDRRAAGRDSRDEQHKFIVRSADGPYLTAVLACGTPMWSRSSDDAVRCTTTAILKLRRLHDWMADVRVIPC